MYNNYYTQREINRQKSIEYELALKKINEGSERVLI